MSARSPVGVGSAQQDQVRHPAEAEACSPGAAGKEPDSRQHPEQDDGGPGTGCQPSSAAGDASHDPATAPVASDQNDGLTANERKILRAILSLQTDGAFVTYQTIAERSGVQKDSLSHYTKSLEDKGWLRRDGPVSDRRYHVLRNPDGGSANHTRQQRQFNMRAHRGRDHDRKRGQARAAAAKGTCSACGQKPQQVDDELCADCAKLVTRAGKPASAYGGEPGNLSRTSGGTEADNIVTSG